MISLLREKTQNSRYFRYFIWFAVAALVIIPLAMQRGGGARDIVKVGSRSVTANEARRRHMNLQEQAQAIRQQLGDAAEQFLNMMGLGGDLQRVAIESLVEERLLDEAAHAAGMKHVSPGYVQEKLEDRYFAGRHLRYDLPHFLYTQAGELNVDLLKRYLRNQGMTIGAFEELVENGIRRLTLQDVLMTTAPRVSYFTRTAQSHMRGERTYDVYRIAKEDYRDRVGDVSQDAIRQVYENNKEQYRVPEKRFGRVWEFTPEGFGKDYSLQKSFVHDAQQAVQGGAESRKAFIKDHKAKAYNVVSDADDTDPAVANKLRSMNVPGGFAYFVHEDRGFIVKYAERQASYVPKLEDVSDVIARQLYEASLKEALQNDLDAAMDNLATGASTPKALRSSYKKQYQGARSLAYDDEAAWSKAKDEGLPTDRMARMIHAGYAFYSVDQQGDAFLIVLTSHTKNKNGDGDMGAFDENIQREERQALYGSFIASLHERAKIEYMMKQ